MTTAPTTSIAKTPPTAIQHLEDASLSARRNPVATTDVRDLRQRDADFHQRYRHPDFENRRSVEHAQEYLRQHADSPDSDDAGNLHEEPLDQTIRGPPVAEAPEFTQFLDDLRTHSRAQTPAITHTPLPPAPPVTITAPTNDPLAMSGVQGTDPPPPPAPSGSGTRELTRDEQIFQMVASVTQLASTVQTLA